MDDASRCYDPGYAAGATLRRCATPSETVCEQGLVLRLDSWASRHFARFADSPASYRQLCREHLRRGFRDGFWGRARVRDAALERVA
ncbi:MAG: hypothetical protein AB7E79_15515 [Rhodospirillaceae bacterium]